MGRSDGVGTNGLGLVGLGIKLLDAIRGGLLVLMGRCDGSNGGGCLSLDIGGDQMGRLIATGIRSGDDGRDLVLNVTALDRSSRNSGSNNGLLQVSWRVFSGLVRAKIFSGNNSLRLLLLLLLLLDILVVGFLISLGDKLLRGVGISANSSGYWYISISSNCCWNGSLEMNGSVFSG